MQTACLLCQVMRVIPCVDAPIGNAAESVIGAKLRDCRMVGIRPLPQNHGGYMQQMRSDSTHCSIMAKQCDRIAAIFLHAIMPAFTDQPISG